MYSYVSKLMNTLNVQFLLIIALHKVRHVIKGKMMPLEVLLYSLFLPIGDTQIKNGKRKKVFTDLFMTVDELNKIHPKLYFYFINNKLSPTIL